MKKSIILLMAAASLALAGCGGDGDPEPPAATSQVPATASQSVAGMVAFLKDLIASSADTLEPVNASTFTPPTSDTTEPTPLT